jgi:hypothetical protein
MRVLMPVEALFLDDELGHAVGEQRDAAVVCVRDHSKNKHAPSPYPVKKSVIGTSYAHTCKLRRDRGQCGFRRR